MPNRHCKIYVKIPTSTQSISRIYDYVSKSPEITDINNFLGQTDVQAKIKDTKVQIDQLHEETERTEHADSETAKVIGHN